MTVLFRFQHKFNGLQIYLSATETQLLPQRSASHSLHRLERDACTWFHLLNVGNDLPIVGTRYWLRMSFLRVLGF